MIQNSTSVYLSEGNKNTLKDTCTPKYISACIIYIRYKMEVSLHIVKFAKIHLPVIQL